MSFYLVDNELFNDLKYGYGEEMDPFNLGDAIKCELCGRYLTGREWLPPYKVKMSRPYLGDFVTGTITGFLVSERVKDLYEKKGLKGLNNFQLVELYYKGKPIETGKYYYPQIQLSDAKIDLVSSGIEFQDGNDICDCCQNGRGIVSHMNGVIFENPNAVEEDVFDSKVFPGPIVSERFKQFVEENGFANLKLVDISTYVPPWLRSPFDGFKIKWDNKKDK